MGRYDFTYGTSLHVILKREKDYVQTGWYKDDKAALKKAIIRMLERPCVEACYYCGGDRKVADKLTVVNIFGIQICLCCILLYAVFSDGTVLSWKFAVW